MATTVRLEIIDSQCVECVYLLFERRGSEPRPWIRRFTLAFDVALLRFRSIHKHTHTHTQYTQREGCKDDGRKTRSIKQSAEERNQMKIGPELDQSPDSGNIP